MDNVSRQKTLYFKMERKNIGFYRKHQDLHKNTTFACDNYFFI